MIRTIQSKFFVLMLAFPSITFAVSLDEIFINIQTCKFSDFYFQDWEPSKPIHPYFSERKLKPYKEESGVYYFKIKDSLFGLPVSEIIVPGTWDFHGVILDVPLDKARTVFKRRFETTFDPTKKSEKGLAPVLEKGGTPGKSFFYCNEYSE